MHILVQETLSFNLMYVTACYPVGTTISKTSSLFTALLQHYKDFLTSFSNKYFNVVFCHFQMYINSINGEYKMLS